MVARFVMVNKGFRKKKKEEEVFGWTWKLWQEVFVEVVFEKAIKFNFLLKTSMEF